MKLKIIIILSFCFFLTGCWNYRELSDLSISTGMSIDKEGDEYRVGMLISNAKKVEGNSKEGESQTIVLDAKGKTILEALKNIELTSPKELYIRHLLVIVISEVGGNLIIHIKDSRVAIGKEMANKILI